MDPERFRDDFQNVPSGIERSVGILKDHLHLPAQGSKSSFRQVCDLLSAKLDAAAGRRHQLQNRHSDGCFTAAAFAHQADRLAKRDIE